MANRPDPIPNQFREHIGHFAAMYSLYKSVDTGQEPHAPDRIFSTQTLEIFHWIDKHPEAQAAIHDFQQNIEQLHRLDENTVRMYPDGRQMLPADRAAEEQAKLFIQGLDVATSGVSGAFGLFLGTIVAPNNPEMQNKLGELFANFGELGSAGVDTLHAGHQNTEFGSRAGRNRHGPKEPLGHGERGIPPGGFTFHPGHTPATENAAAPTQQLGGVTPDAGMSLPDDGSSSVTHHDGGMSLPDDVSGNITAHDGGMSLPDDVGGNITAHDGGMSLPDNVSGNITAHDGGMSLPDDVGGNITAHDGGMSLPDDGSSSVTHHDGGMSLPDDVSGNITAHDGGMSLPDDVGGNITAHDGGMSLPDDVSGNVTAHDGGMSLPDDGSASVTN